MHVPERMAVDPDAAATLAERALDLGERAEALAGFAAEDPDLAREAGVEVAALEARTILGSGAIGRVARAGLDGARWGRPVSLAGHDLEAVTRLEGIIATSTTRIGQRLAALDRTPSFLERAAGVIGLASGALGLWKSIF